RGGRPREIPQGHRGGRAPLRERRDGQDRRDVLEGADPRPVHGQGSVRLARVPRSARGRLGQGPRPHAARRADAAAVDPGRPSRGDTLMPLASEGYTVLDLTRDHSSPTAVRQIDDMGANVIKTEAREEMEGDSTALGFDFLNLHRNKRSMTIDLKHPRGVEIIKRIAARADVVVENFRPDVKKRLGIDYEALSKVNPRLVYGSISGFGQSGPYADRPGYDQIAQGMGGLMSITGLPGQGPVRVGIPVADLTSGLFLAQGILVALLEREKSGKG